MRELSGESKTRLVCLVQLGIIIWFVHRAVGREAASAMGGGKRRQKGK